MARASAQPAQLRPPRLTAIHPGNPTLRVTPIRVNIVLIGYPSWSVDTNRLVSMLPVDGVPPEVYPVLRGVGVAAGDEYRYQYHVVTAGHQFEDGFFAHLAHAGTVGPPDHYQASYNAQADNSLDVGPKVRFIDAQDTERWLESNAAKSLGVDPRDYTVFLIDWYGRTDFQFHTYTNRSNPDPDTGADPRTTLSQPHVRAWGGTSGPTWFFDLSAGPVYTDGSFNVDDADINNTGTTDYRMPPIWDYGHTGYRAFNDLTGDLAKTVRYVAIDELFAASPLFDPLATQPLPGAGKQIALDVFEGDPNTNGLSLIHPDVVVAQHRRLEPYVQFDMTVRDLPLTGGALTAYQIGTFASTAPDCWTPYGFRDVEFVCYFMGHYPDYFPTTTPDDVIPAVGFTVPDDPSKRVRFQGVTDDDFATGTPTLISMLDDAPLRASVISYGYTLMAMHEAGHFVGLAHPHDGADPGQRILFGPDGAFMFVWAGDQSDTVMSYLAGNLSFDVFDIDNLARSLYAREATSADYWAGVLLSGPPNATVYQLLGEADQQFHASDSAITAERWVDAGAYSDTGFFDIERALQIVGILPPSPASATSAVTTSTATAATLARAKATLMNTPHVSLPLGAQPQRAPEQSPCIATMSCSAPINGSGH